MRIVLLVLGLSAIGCKKKVAAPEVNPSIAPYTAPASEKIPSEVVNMARNFNRVYFDLDSARLTAASKNALNENIKIMGDRPDLKLEIQGHADERGTTDYNLALGQRRAQAVYNYMKSQGVAESRLKITSYGEERPLAMGSSETAWSQNRRCEFVITWGGTGDVGGTSSN